MEKFSNIINRDREINRKKIKKKVQIIYINFKLNFLIGS